MKILNMIKFDLIKMLRDKTALMLITLLPIILTFVMGSVYNKASTEASSKIPLGVTAEDKGALVRTLLDEISKDKSLNIVECSQSELISNVKNANVELGIIIPEDFSSKASQGAVPVINVLKLPSSSGYIALEGIISAAYSKIGVKTETKAYLDTVLINAGSTQNESILNEIERNFEQNLSIQLVSSETIKYEGKSESVEYDGKAGVSLGMAVMFVMFTLILGAGEILDEKKNNTWGRLMITPTARTSIALGKVLGSFFKGWVQIAVLILFGKFVMGVSWGNSMISTIIIMSVYLLCITSLGMFLSSLVKTNAQLGAYSSVLIICTSMLSGCYWPVEMMSPVMQKAASFFPQYWAMKGLNSTVVGNMGFSSITTPLLVLTGMGLLFFILSVFNGRFKVDFKKRPAVEATGKQAI